MKFQCPHCRAGYQIDESRIPEKGVQTPCKQCGKPMILTRQGVVGAASPPVESATPEPPTDGKSGDDLAELEARVGELLAADDQDAAAGVFLDMVARCLQACDFTRAEAIRDRMYEDTPMALNEVLKAGEMIEEGKCEAMDPEHLERWASIYESLSQEESGELFFSLQEMTFSEGQAIVRQGDADGSLILVEKGLVKLLGLAPENAEEVKIREAGAGDIIGTEQFFSFSVWTFSVVAVDDCRLRLIPRAQRLRWLAEFPGLENKLRSHCTGLESPAKSVVRQGIELRAAERHPCDLKAGIRALNSKRIPSDRSIGVRITDISTGGACLDIKLSKPEEADGLLDCTIRIDMVLQVSGAEKPVALQARVVAVHFHAFGDCTVHVHFLKPIGEKVLPLFTG